ncbi:MAG: metallophosphoesterase [candidate division KSB1 bacterium]
MRTYLPHLVCAGALVFIALLTRALLRSYLPSWWQKPPVKFLQRWAPRVGLLCILVWMLGTAQQDYTLIVLGASLVVVVLISAAMILAALPFAMGLHVLHARVALERHPPQGGNVSTSSLFRGDKDGIGNLAVSPPLRGDNGVCFAASTPSINRREFLRTAAAAMPVLSTASGLTGIAKSFDEVRLPVFHFKFADLPSALHGLKICQLSDMHLGYFRGVNDMEKLCARVAAQQPDLVLVTGDLADDLMLLPTTLRLLEALAPPLGVYASLGNHEYYRGIKTVRKYFEASAIPLLCNAGVSVPAKGATLFLGGTDDPSRSRHTDFSVFFPQTTEAALREAPTGAFKILMSHRPQSFYSAAELGAQLTLAGHTHGMQIGYNGRSLFELDGSEKLLWGHYHRGVSQLYTTSGVGHWFPFRLGCPPEAPIIVLERS